MTLISTAMIQTICRNEYTRVNERKDKQFDKTDGLRQIMTVLSHMLDVDARTCNSRSPFDPLDASHTRFERR